jgi:hypothetical protein
MRHGSNTAVCCPPLVVSNIQGILKIHTFGVGRSSNASFVSKHLTDGFREGFAMRRLARIWRIVVTFAVAMAVTGGAFATDAFADAAPPFIPPDADWLMTVNYYREMANLPSVAADPVISAGAYNHSCYMLQNGISHDEIPGLPGYTPSGDLAGNNGNVAVSSAYNATARSHVELWMTGPFHAIGVLRPNLKTVGFGKCDDPSTPLWHSGATLDIIRGLGPQVPQIVPITFPGNGTTTNLDRFVVETPDPLGFCGWTGAAGLPVIALMPEALGSAPAATMRSSNGNLEVCVLSQYNTTGTAQAILAGNNAVVVIPRNHLAADSYTVSVTSHARVVGWTFTVDPTAATGVQPVPTTAPLGSGGGLQPIVPERLVDTRLNLGASRLAASTTKRIQIAGRGGVPADAQAISANFTVVGPEVASYLSIWNCSASRPTVSTLNFDSMQTVPNGANVPLDATGGVCVFSPSSTDLVVDVNGYFSPTASGHFASVAPARLLDTRSGLGAPSRLDAFSTTVLRVTGAEGIPEGATAAMLNVTSVYPAYNGFVTVYPCDAPRPTVSSLNPSVWTITPNNVVTPVAADGTVCIYTSTPVDLVVDITGSVNAAATYEFVPAAPFRLTDTRDRSRVEMQGGANGLVVAQGQTLVIQVAGTRGIAAGAKGISANFTAVGASTWGYLTVWPCGERPTTSVVNFGQLNAIANGAQVPLSESGQLCVYASNPTHVIIDVNGWWK